MQISAETRATAATIDRERHKVETRGARSALLFGARARMLAYAAWRTTGDVDAVSAAIRAALAGSQRLGQRGIAELLADDMVAAHLLGRRRTALIAGPQLADVRLAADDAADLNVAGGRVAVGAAVARRVVNVFTEAIRHLVERLELTPDDVEALRRTYAGEVRRVINSMGNQLERAIRATLIEQTVKGSGVRDGIRALREVFEAEGFSAPASHTLEAIFRTQTQMAYAAGRWNAQQDPAVQEVLWGYEYAAIMDDRTTEDICVPLNGMVREKRDPVWLRLTPPNHWNCRSTVVELFAPQRQTPVPVGVEPQKGFDFNPGVAFRDDFLPRRFRNRITLSSLVLDNCGTGAGGFQPGNTCAKPGKRTFISIDKLLHKINVQSEGGINLRAVREALEAGGRLYELKELLIDDLVGTGDADVDASHASDAKGPIVVGADGFIIDGRHRAAAARKRGQKTIMAYAPALPSLSLDCGTGAGGFKIGNTCAKGGKVTPGIARADHPARVKVSFTNDDTYLMEKVDHALEKMDLTMADIPDLVGAPDGSEIEVMHTTFKDEIAVKWTAPGMSAQRTLRMIDQRKFIENDYFYLDKDQQGQSVGTRAFARQVAAAKANGFTNIICTALRGEDSNGYYSWPRMGYDGLLSDVAVSTIDPRFDRDGDWDANYTRVSDYMKTQRGREYWKRWGSTFKARFDLADDSLSMRVLGEYLSSKGLTLADVDAQGLGDELDDAALDAIWDKIGAESPPPAPVTPGDGASTSRADDPPRD